MSPSENSVGAALNQRLLNASSSDPNGTTTAALNNLLYQDTASSKASIKQITASDRAQLITVSPLTAMNIGATYDRLDTALLDGNVNVDVPAASFDGVPLTIKTTAPMTLDTANNLWFKLLRGYESCGGVDGKSHDWRVGVYASHDNGTWKTQGLISYGHNCYDFNRYVPDGKLYSDYTAKVFDINAKVKYLPQYNRAKSWQVAPYVALAYTHTSQDAYTEDGSVGYKRVLSGVNPELNGTFAGDTNNFTLYTDNDRNYVTYSLNLKKNTGHNRTVQGEIRGEKSKNNHSEVYSAMAKYAF